MWLKKGTNAKNSTFPPLSQLYTCFLVSESIAPMQRPSVLRTPERRSNDKRRGPYLLFRRRLLGARSSAPPPPLHENSPGRKGNKKREEEENRLEKEEEGFIHSIADGGADQTHTYLPVCPDLEEGQCTYRGRECVLPSLLDSMLDGESFRETRKEALLSENRGQ